MMHDRGKSDSAILAVKPTNNAGQPAAEPVEPRAGTKRNAGEQSTHRTQSRARVTQALARVRKAAQQRRKEKFTALFHLGVDLLREAFLVLKRDAAPGMDGLTWQPPQAEFTTSLEQLVDGKVALENKANDPQQSWGFGGEPPEAVMKDSGTRDGTL
jgi:RNA-directed DNA polymerase